MSDARQAMSDMLGRLHQSHFAIIPADVYQNVDDKSAGGEGRTGARSWWCADAGQHRLTAVCGQMRWGVLGGSCIKRGSCRRLAGDGHAWLLP
jgi:hypothetical protein